MFKKILLLMLAALLVIPLAGCRKKEEAIDISALIDDHTAFNFGELETFDTDYDGYIDNLVYTLERQELAEDLFLDRTIQYTESEDVFTGELVLEFENTGDESTTYSHTEIIPKSFAESVEDLEFSVPPDEIIYPDAVVRWEVEVIKKTITKIFVSTKKSAEEVGTKKGTEAGTAAAFGEVAESLGELSKAAKGEKVDWGKAMAGLGGAAAKGSKVGREAGIKAGQEAAIDNILSSFDDFAFISALNVCGSLDGTGRDECMLRLVRRFRDRFNESVCKEAFPDADFEQKACTAIATNDINECKKCERRCADACTFLVTHFDKCSGIKDKDELQNCYYQQAIECQCDFVCDQLDNSDKRYLCHAKVTGDKTWCEKIQDPDLKRECMGESEEVVEEEEEVVGDDELPSFNYGSIKVTFDATYSDVETGEEHFSSAQSVSFGPPEGQYEGKTSPNGFNISWTETGDDEGYPDNPLYSYVFEGSISVTIDPDTHDVTSFTAESTLTYGSGASFHYAVSGGHCNKSSESSEWLTCSHSVDEGGWTPQITWSEVPGDPEGPGFAMYNLLKADYRNTLIELEVR
jgi:hypothetical protein